MIYQPGWNRFDLVIARLLAFQAAYNRTKRKGVVECQVIQSLYVGLEENLF